MKHKTDFSLWMFNSDVKDVLIFLIPLLSRIHDIFHFKYLANLRGGKGGIFIVGPGWHLASLRHWVCTTNYEKNLLTHFVFLKLDCGDSFTYAHEASAKTKYILRLQKMNPGQIESHSITSETTFSLRSAYIAVVVNYQARNQLGTPGVAKSFVRGAQIFELCPIALKYVQHIFPRRPKNLSGTHAPLRTPLLRPVNYLSSPR